MGFSLNFGKTLTLHFQNDWSVWTVMVHGKHHQARKYMKIIIILKVPNTQHVYKQPRNMIKNVFI